MGFLDELPSEAIASPDALSYCHLFVCQRLGKNHFFLDGNLYPAIDLVLQ